MKHFGDITKLSGYDLPIVDVITGGSPCQDLSVANGKRVGLEGERSGLFMEQIRIVKEMRERDRKENGRTGEFIRPRYMWWENVPGALSSNGGADFQVVLSEIIRIAEPEAPDVPLPRNGKWALADAYYGDWWSVAYRVHDAQFWGTTMYVDGRTVIPGTPQRRRRIALVADFGGRSAPSILFERAGMRRHSRPSTTQREEATTGTGTGTEETGRGINGNVALSFQERAGKAGGGKGILIQDEHVGALSTLTNQSVLQVVLKEPIAIEMTSTKNTIVKDGISPTLTARMGTGGNQVNAILESED